MAIDPLHKFPGYALRRASAAAMSGLAKRMQSFHLRPTEATVLMVIGSNPGITQSDIGQLLDIARANMTPLSARLQKRHLIVRSRVDGRSHGLTLSENGMRLVQRIRASMTEHEAQLMARIPTRLHAPFLEALAALWSPARD